MVSNAQLHNEKSTLIYQVETLREELSDLEELLWEARRQYDDRGKVRGHMGVCRGYTLKYSNYFFNNDFIFRIEFLTSVEHVQRFCNVF